VWPVFYCDVTDAYRLGKGGRLRVDLGGIYFNGLFALGCAVGYLVTAFEPLLFVIVLQHLAVFQQLIPLLRLDGYYVMSDLTGVPDILTRIKPVLLSLVPSRKADAAVEALKPWVRVVVSAYVLALVPFLLLILALIVISAPRVLATAWDSLGIQIDRMHGSLDDGRALAVAAGGLQTAALVLPAAGTIAALSRLGRRIALALGHWAGGRAPRTAALAALGLALAAFTAYVLWPDGDYRPIGPEDRGTVEDAVRGLKAMPGSRLSSSVEGADGQALPARGGSLSGLRRRSQRHRTPAAGSSPSPDRDLPRQATPPAAMVAGGGRPGAEGGDLMAPVRWTPLLRSARHPRPRDPPRSPRRPAERRMILRRPRQHPEHVSSRRGRPAQEAAFHSIRA